MNLLLDGFGGLRPIFQDSGLPQKPNTIVSTLPYEFALGRLKGLRVEGVKESRA